MGRYVTEFAGTFFLVLTIGLTVVQEVPVAPLAIGAVVMAGAFAVGDISGGVFNPAVGTGPVLVALVAGGSPGDLWIYWVGPVAGAALAVPVYRMQHAGEQRRQREGT